MDLIVQDLHKRLGGQRVLDGANLRCGPGETVVVRGPNGTGKSTLLRLISGILVPDAGQIRLGALRLDPEGGDGAAARRHIGYVPDASEPLPELLVEEFFRLWATLKQLPAGSGHAAAELRERLGVGGLMRRRLTALSFGQRKRVCLCGALLGDPHLLLCDEPSDGLDPDGVAAVLALLRERAGRGRSAVLTTNDLSFAQAVGGTAYFVRAGKLERGPS
ncbi:MAG: ABC transporter ATP-binding protein [Polyangia bacterium]